MERKLVLCLVSFSILISACGPKLKAASELSQLDSAAPTILVGARGTWLVPCQTSGVEPFYQSSQVEVSSQGATGVVHKLTHYFSDSSCGGQALAQEDAYYVNVQESSSSDLVTMDVSQIGITFFQADAAACGITDWQVGVSHDVLGKDCSSSGFGNYSLLAVGTQVPYIDSNYSGAEEISPDPLP